MSTDLQHLALGHHRIACPQCAKTTNRKKDTALSVDVTASSWVCLCHRCGYATGSGAGVHSGSQARSMHTETTRQHLVLASHWRDVWHVLRPVEGTALKYLTARECVLPPADCDLRYTESLQHPSGYTGPALVALVTDALTREPMTLHRTWIKANGDKADVNPPRLLLGKHRKAGGVIRLWPDDTVTTGLAIAEGIETALSVATAYTPIWSTIDAGNMAAFPVLEGIEELLIVADHDAAGLRAAEQCAQRWYDVGRKVRIAKSPVPGEDLNDLARRAA